MMGATGDPTQAKQEGDVKLPDDSPILNMFTKNLKTVVPAPKIKEKKKRKVEVPTQMAGLFGSNPYYDVNKDELSEEQSIDEMAQAKGSGLDISSYKRPFQRVMANTFLGSINPLGYEHGLKEWGTLPFSFVNALNEEITGKKLYNYPTDKNFNDPDKVSIRARDRILAEAFGTPLRNKENEDIWLKKEDGTMVLNPNNNTGNIISGNITNDVMNAYDLNKETNEWLPIQSQNNLGTTTITKPKVETDKNIPDASFLNFNMNDPWDYDSFYNREENPTKRKYKKKAIDLFNMVTGNKPVNMNFSSSLPVLTKELPEWAKTK
jgi:hypothetical protein